MKFLAAIIPFLFMTCACKKNGCGAFTAFTGITERSEDGNLIKNDPSDWTLKDKWDDWEAFLFERSYRTDCVPSSSFAIKAYPNPTKGTFYININKTPATTLDMRLIDSDCNVIASYDSFRSNAIAMQPGNKKGMVRLYYRFIEDGCEYQGHGDIRVQPSTDRTGK